MPESFDRIYKFIQICLINKFSLILISSINIGRFISSVKRHIRAKRNILRDSIQLDSNLHLLQPRPRQLQPYTARYQLGGRGAYALKVRGSARNMVNASCLHNLEKYQKPARYITLAPIVVLLRGARYSKRGCLRCRCLRHRGSGSLGGRGWCC